MIQFAGIKVRSFAVNYYDIYWELESHNSDIQEWQFFVDRSSVENGEFVQIAGPLTDQYYLRDNIVHTLSQARTWFYRVRAVRLTDGYEIISNSSDADGEADLICEEIVRNEYVMWREFSGIAIWLFSKRTFGQRCPGCYNSRLGKTTTPSCEVCWGTGYSGGYHRPVKIWGEIQGNRDLQVVRSAEDQRALSGAIFVGPPSPDVTIGDLLVDARNRRWLVTAVGGSMRLGVTVRQQHILIPVERTQIQFKVPLNIDTSAEELRGARNFSNPQNLDAAKRDTSYEDILRVYGFG